MKTKRREPLLGSLSFYWANGGGDRMSSEFNNDPNEETKGLVIEPYGNRFYALYDGQDLVCVTVYKKGAQEVKRRLEMAFIQRDR